MQFLPEPDRPESSVTPVPSEWDRLNAGATRERPSYGYAPNPMGSAAQGSLFEYWRILRRRKGTVVFSSFIGLLLGVLITLPQTPSYRVRTSLEIQDVNQDFMNLKQVNPVAETSSAINALGDIQTQIKILQSDTLAERTIAKLKTASRGTKPPDTRIAIWRNALNFPEPPDPDARENMLKAMAEHLKVRTAVQTRMIEVFVDSIDPNLAVSFANTLASEFIDQNIQARWQMTRRTGESLGPQLNDIRTKLEHSEDALQTYARRNGLIFTADKQNVSEEKLNQLQAELSRAQADRVAKQSHYEITRTTTPETLPDVLNDSNLRTLEASLTDLRSQEAELGTTFKPEYSKSRKIHAQIASLESALERERKAIVDRIANEYQEALRRERLLAAAYGGQALLVTQDSEKSIQYNILNREVDTNRQIYEAMLLHVNESAVASAMKASNVRVIDAARVPEFPYRPSLPLNAALGLLIGCMLGIVRVVMRDRVDRTLQEPGDMAFYIGAPELAIIPTAAAHRRFSLYPSRKHTADSIIATTSLMQAAENRYSTSHLQLATYCSQPSMIAESFRALVASVLFVGENGGRPRVVVVTSAGPGEGKTTAACNLAIGLAQIERKVLLVDGDLRKPSLHGIFQLENKRGLVDILKQRELDAASIAECIQGCGIDNLSILTTGAITSPAANLLFGAAMPNLIAHLKNNYDMVIIDTPPMLQMPDARVLGRISDGVLLIARANHTTRDAAIAARDRLLQDRTRVIGVVLNDWNPKLASNGYYGYHHNQHQVYYQHRAGPRA